MRPVRIRGVAAAALACAGAAGIAASRAQAQQLIGYVSTKDADISGAVDVMDGEAVLAGSAGVTAKEHAAAITLGRGGMVRVCQTSALHVTESKTSQAGGNAAEAASRAAVAETASEAAPPLLFSLDRGAIEIQMNGTAADAIMTPDLRMTVRAQGPLDLRLRVARNGDTCVENRGAQAPTLAVSDPFGESNYELRPGQHVLFEHGSVHEVVDHETEPCGCPEEKGANVAEALLAPGSAAQTGEKAAHPFPAAVSEGLAPAAEVPQAAAGAAHTQVSESLSYDATAMPNAAAGVVPAPGSAPNAGATAGAAVGSSAGGVKAAQTAAKPTTKATVQPKTTAKAKSASGGNGAASGAAGQSGAEGAGVQVAAVQPAPAQQQASSGSAGAAQGDSASTQQNASQAQQPGAAQMPQRPLKRDLAHLVGRFFKRAFGS